MTRLVRNAPLLRPPPRLREAHLVIARSEATKQSLDRFAALAMTGKLAVTEKLAMTEKTRHNGRIRDNGKNAR